VTKVVKSNYNLYVIEAVNHQHYFLYVNMELISTFQEESTWKGSTLSVVLLRWSKWVFLVIFL